MKKGKIKKQKNKKIKNNMLYHMNNILYGRNVAPSKNIQTPQGNQFSMMRQIFQNTPKTNPTNDTTKRGKNTLYQDHGSYLQRKKTKAMGKEMYNSPLSYNSHNPRDVTNAKRRMRSSGPGVPVKSSLNKN